MNLLNLLAQVTPGGGGAGTNAGNAGGAGQGGAINNAGGTGGITNPVLGTLGNTSGTTFFSTFVGRVINFVFIVGSIIFLFMLVAGGIQWISAGGDKQNLENARSRVANALTGIVILFSVYAILFLIQTFFGITILTLDIAPLVIQ